jgi:hypothetical protein
MGTTTIYSSTANVNTTFSAANTSLLTLQTSRPHNNHTFFDNSPFNNLITRNGNPNQGTFSPYGTGWSNYFDGTGDYLTFPITANNQFGTGNFTIEFWSYFISRGVNGAGFITNYDLYQSSSFGIFAGHVSADTTKYQVAYDGGAFPAISSTETIKYNQWAHIAAVRNGTTITLYINGVANGTLTNASATLNGSGSTGWCIGAAGDAIANYSSTGYISDLRIIKGTAVYTGNFTPPTRTLLSSGTSTIYPNEANVNVTFPQENTSLLTCQSNRFIDNSVNNVTLTRNGDVSVQKFSPYEPSPPFSDSTQFLQSSLVRGSAYFDGTGDLLTVPASAAFAPGTGAFTVEGWYYSMAASGNQQMWAQTVGGTDYFVVMFTPATSQFRFIGNGVDAFSTAIAKPNAWNHFAVVRVGTSVTVYCNGIGGTPVTFSNDFTNTTYVPTISGYTHSATNMLTGYLSDLRYVKGAAVYTGNFTPPTAPLLQSGTSTTYTNTANINTTFAAANTTLLLNFANATVKDYSGISTIEHTGNARLASNVSKFGGTALYFDGTTGTQLKVSKLAANNPPTTVVGTANLTAEMWVYPLGRADTNYSLFTFGSETTGRYITWLANGQVRTNYYGGSTVNLGGNVQPNVWSHIAIVKRGSNIAGYVNGTLLPNTETNSSSIGNGGANIGSDGSGAAVFFGYIDDVRITNGNVRYTANFNVPNQLTIP